MSYLLILAVEELLDYMNRATMRDERVHPVSRAIAKLHVLEEARHVSFAKTYLAESWPTLDEARRRELPTCRARARGGRRRSQCRPRGIRASRRLDAGDYDRSTGAQAVGGRPVGVATMMPSAL